MAKSAASLSVGLIARRIAPTGEPTVPPLTSAERGEFEARAEAIEAMPSTRPPPGASGEADKVPSSGLTAGLIAMGRQAYKAERQRRAELGSGSGFDLTRPGLRGDAVRAPRSDQFRWRVRREAPEPMARVAVPDLPQAAPPPPGLEPPAESVEPPMTSMARDIAGLPGLGAPGRRKALTLRLLPDQHGLLRVREFALELAENPNYPQFIMFQLTGDRCEKLDDFSPDGRCRHRRPLLLRSHIPPGGPGRLHPFEQFRRGHHEARRHGARTLPGFRNAPQ